MIAAILDLVPCKTRLDGVPVVIAHGGVQSQDDQVITQLHVAEVPTFKHGVQWPSAQVVSLG